MQLSHVYHKIYPHLINLKNTSQIKNYDQAVLQIIYFTFGLLLLSIALYFAYLYLDEYWFLKYPLLAAIILIFAILITFPSNTLEKIDYIGIFSNFEIYALSLIKGSFAIIIFYFMLTEPYLPQVAQFCYDYLYAKYIYC